jgi:two-component system chemotaxis sensor kinase CheA
MNALHEQFVVETRELIHQATDDLIAAEREGFSPERVDRVFRAFHTLKGSAGVVDLPAMSLTLHAAEDVLAAISAGRMAVSPGVIDDALACLDQVSGWVDAFEVHQALPPRAGEDARAMAERLRKLLSASAGTLPGRSETVATEPALPDWATGLLASWRERAGNEASAPPYLFALVYEPHAGCFFNGDDPLDLMRRVPNVVAFSMEAREAWPPLEDFDPLACNLRLQALASATREELATVFRLVPDQVRFFEIPASVLQAEPGVQPAIDDMAMLARAILEEQMHVLRAAAPNEDHIGRFGAAARTAANALRHANRHPLAQRIESAAAESLSHSEASPLLSAIDEALSAIDDESTDAAEGPDNETQPRAGGRSLRVAEARIDALIDLAGELLVVKNGFVHLARRVEAEIGGHDIARLMRGQHEAMERLAGELHGAILQLRMVPIAQVFRTFPRLVRDMAQRLGKDVTLLTRGESTECDKTIADLLFEPLLHLVRNALDHGLDPAVERSAAGKPKSGTITLAASRTGDRFVIEVSDDGRGIDPTMVRRKAAERGLLPPDELAAMPDEQVIELIFAAGFSTAANVSEISGRGVGMDVVRTTIERIGGRVTLNSRAGLGTKVTLDLPVNIAMSRIMVVEAGGQVFGIAMEAVSETIRLTPDRISRIKNNDGFVLHDRVVPICSLAEIMHLPAPRAPGNGDRLVVVAEIGGRVTALEVDAIRDRLEVVLKPMQGLLSNARGYVGTTLTADGAVLLVLDLKEILP